MEIQANCGLVVGVKLILAKTVENTAFAHAGVSEEDDFKFRKLFLFVYSLLVIRFYWEILMDVYSIEAYGGHYHYEKSALFVLNNSNIEIA